jgi:two-component system sensor kinase FixL
VVEARRVDGLVQVSVSDNGSGQPDAELPKIFEPFFTTKPQGLGMGLAISKTIIEDHGGRIWAEAIQSGGLTIRFTLPAGKEAP